MVATSESCGRSTRGGLGGGGGAFATGTDATAGGGGRRDDEKIGRSRVFDNVANGTAHSGLALGVRSGAVGGCSGGLTATGAGAAVESQSDDAAMASARRAASASVPSTSVGSAELGAGMQSEAGSRKVSPIANFRIVSARVILHLAIVRRPRAEHAVCRRPARLSSPGPGPGGDRRP